jgi:hypothetical protein
VGTSSGAPSQAAGSEVLTAVIMEGTVFWDVSEENVITIFKVEQ